MLYTRTIHVRFKIREITRVRKTRNVLHVYKNRNYSERSNIYIFFGVKDIPRYQARYASVCETQQLAHWGIKRLANWAPPREGNEDDLRASDVVEMELWRTLLRVTRLLPEHAAWSYARVHVTKLMNSLSPFLPPAAETGLLQSCRCDD